jgi:hypothetical protein
MSRQQKLIVLIRKLDASLCEISSLLLDSSTSSFDLIWLSAAKCQTELSLMQLYQEYDAICSKGAEKIRVEKARRKLEEVFAIS